MQDKSNKIHVCSWDISADLCVDLISIGSVEVLDSDSVRVCIASSRSVAREIVSRWNSALEVEEKIVGWQSVNSALNRENVGLQEDCETWRKAAIKAEKRDSINLKAFAAYVRDRSPRAVMSDEEVSEIISEWVENEELPL